MKYIRQGVGEGEELLLEAVASRNSYHPHGRLVRLCLCCVFVLSVHVVNTAGGKRGGTVAGSCSKLE